MASRRVALLLLCIGCAATEVPVEAPPARPRPPPTACEARLQAAGIEFNRAAPTRGVPEPLWVRMPLGGVRYRYLYAERARAWMFMDCELVSTMLELGRLLERHGVVEVVDLGVYSYRCKSRLRDCARGMSLHSVARAIDVAGLVTADGTFYSVESHWKREPRGTPFCRRRDARADRFLHTVLCDIQRAGLFTRLLTPNFNEAHRNHWHLELHL